MTQQAGCADAPDKLRRRARPGQSLVELAVMLPLLTLILLGAVDLGRAFFYYNQLSNAVAQGALYGIRYPINVTNGSNAGSGDPNNITYIVTHESTSNIGNVTVVCYVQQTSTLRNGGNCAATDVNGTPLVQSGDTIVVRATYAFQPITAQILGILGNGYTMSKTVKMVVL